LYNTQYYMHFPTIQHPTHPFQPTRSFTTSPGSQVLSLSFRNMKHSIMNIEMLENVSTQLHRFYSGLTSFQNKKKSSLRPFNQRDRRQHTLTQALGIHRDASKLPCPTSLANEHVTHGPKYFQNGASFPPPKEGTALPCNTSPISALPR
jgi:hypothetical protein